DSLKFLTIVDASLMTAAFRDKQVLAYSGSDEEIKVLQRDFRDLAVYETRENVGGSAIVMNVDLAPISDNRVRQAIVKAINRQQIVDAVGTGWVGTGIPVPSLDWVLPPADINRI